MHESRRSQRHLPLLALSLAALVVFAGCSEKHRSPTEPESIGSSFASVSSAGDAARPGNKPPKPPKPPGGKPGGDLSLEMQPDVWNTNWEHSAGTVSALIRGDGLDKVDLSSIQLVGTEAGGTPLPAQRAQRTGNQVRAFFDKSEALDTLDTPKRGETHEVKVELDVDGEAQTLTARVRIVGPNGGGGDDDDEEVDLSVEIQPDSWNTNWRRSSGTVTALIRGGDLADVDLRSIELVGTDPAAAPLPALRASRNGNHIRAYFDKGDAYETLDTPRPGETHKIIIRLDVGDEDDAELSDRIRVVGPSRDADVP
jgi:hypothetical protein